MGKAFLAGIVGGENDSPFYVKYNTQTNQLSQLIPKETLTIPSSTDGIFGSPLFSPYTGSTAEHPNITNILKYAAKRIIVPSYFSNFNCNFNFNHSSIVENKYSNLEAIEWYGNGSCTQFTNTDQMQNLYQNRNLKEIIAPNYTGVFLFDPNPAYHSSFKYVVPHASRIIQYHTSGSTTPSYWELTDDSDFSGVVYAGINQASSASISRPFYSMAGNIHLDFCTTFYGSPVPMQGIQSKPLNIYLPRITTWGSAYYSPSSVDTASGYANVYIGGNLTSMNTAILNYCFIGNINRGHLTVHIPAGDSSTKNLFDNNGVTYIQDYDLPED